MLTRLVKLSSEPPEHPIRRITLYYILLALSIALLIGVWPPLLDYLRGNSQQLMSGSFLEPAKSVPIPGASAYHMEIALIVSMVGSMLLMLPLSWGYMGARRTTGFDQAVVQTVVVLPMAVAGIVVMVKNSVALAFSLAGVVAGVRFRNSLSDTADALYIFVAIGVGLAAGIGELGVAAVISVVLNYVIMSLWHSDYGVCPNGGPKNGWSASAAKVKLDKDEKKKNKKLKKEKEQLEVETAEATAG